MRKKLQPSVITINAMLAAYAKGEQREKALDLMEAAPEAGRPVRNLPML
jgi:pentatricopeptide repeat protein